MFKTASAQPQLAKNSKSTPARTVINSLALSLVDIRIPIEFPYDSIANATYIKQEIYAVWRRLEREEKSKQSFPIIKQKGTTLRVEPGKGDGK